MALGVGIHGCVGQNVARAEVDAVLTAIAERVGSIELAGTTAHNSAIAPAYRSRMAAYKRYHYQDQCEFQEPVDGHSQCLTRRHLCIDNDLVNRKLTFTWPV